MSNFDETLMKRLTKLEREVERLRVKESPGAWIDYTPTVTAASGSITSYTSSGRYCRIGKAVVCNFTITITNNGTGSGAIYASIPVALSGVAIGVGRENVNTGKLVQLYATGTSIVIWTYDNLYPVATNSVLICSIAYEAA